MAEQRYFLINSILEDFIDQYETVSEQNNKLDFMLICRDVVVIFMIFYV